MSTRRYYAVEYAYGSHIINTAGGRADRVYYFASARERDRWVDDGPNNTTASGARDAIGSRSRLLRQWEPMSWPEGSAQ